MKKKKEEKIFVWVSIGTDGNLIGIAWYKENLNANLKRIRMRLVKP